MQARAQLELRKRKRYAVSVGDFVTIATPDYSRPNHLAPFLDVLEEIKSGKQVFACVSVPPRHAKTDTFSRFAVQTLGRKPSTRFVYASYAAERAEEVGFDTLRVADRLGVNIDDEYRRAKHWRTQEGGGFRCVGIGGPLVGAGADVIAIDDPIKNRQEAESRLMRDRAWDWIQNVAMTRLEPGASLILFHQRWHEDDPIGRAVKQLGWPDINLPALDDDGAPLWPERYDVEALSDIRGRVGEHAWHSQYMGRPRGRADRLFGPATTYKALPGEGLTWGAGADLAYSTRTSSDYTGFVAMARLGKDPETALYYLVENWRGQVETREAKTELEAFRERHPAAGPPLFLGSGTEKGAAALMPLEWRAAVADKFTRSQPLAAAWNAGRVLVPEHAPWLDDYLDEFASFTGAGDAHDDQVDATVGAFTRLTEPARRPFVFV